MALVQFGIPSISKHIAYTLSPEVSAQLADTSLEQLDEFYFSRTELPAERRAEINQLFLSSLPSTDLPRHDYQLHFRKGDAIGPNAFALPNGSIIITDELIDLAKDDLEILSILYHEIGHVHYRHSLRQIIQSAGVLGVSVWLTGNIDSLFDWTAAVPAFFMQRKYSRDMEAEADDYSLDKMQEHGLDPMHFVNIMTRMQAYNPIAEPSSQDEHEEPATKEETASTETSSHEAPDSHGDTKTSRFLNLLSSHPNTEERMAKFRLAAAKEAQPHTN